MGERGAGIAISSRGVTGVYIVAFRDSGVILMRLSMAIAASPNSHSQKLMVMLASLQYQ